MKRNTPKYKKLVYNNKIILYIKNCLQQSVDMFNLEEQYHKFSSRQITVDA